jgi:hypothetical protein
MIREIIKKIKEKKEHKEISDRKLHIGMSVCVERRDLGTYMSRAEIGVIIANLNCDIYLVKFNDGSVDSYKSDSIYTNYDKELLK